VAPGVMLRGAEIASSSLACPGNGGADWWCGEFGIPEGGSLVLQRLGALGGGFVTEDGDTGGS
jgi:hypothetical protein